jgi:Protein of unknown function (DUF904).
VTLDDIIRRNEELELQYAKAIETITRLQNRIKKLEDENTKLRRQNDILMRAIEIATQIDVQTNDLRSVLKRIRGVRA